jgi:hypothetical protein
MKKESGTVDYFTDDVVMPNQAGKGFKIGSWNETEAETPSFGWRDITTQVISRGVGPTDPPWTAINSGPFSAFKFDVGDQVWAAVHVPHDIVPGTDVYFHAHWMRDNAQPSTAAEPVKWEFTYTYAKGFDQEAFNDAGETPVTAEAASATSFQHMVTETDAVTITGLTEPDGIIYMRVRRVTNGATENTCGIFLLTTDVHYQSTNLTTRGKAPGFYE